MTHRARPFAAALRPAVALLLGPTLLFGSGLLPGPGAALALPSATSVSGVLGLAPGNVAECAIAAAPEDGPLLIGGLSNAVVSDRSLHLFRSTDGGARWSLTRLGPEYDGLGGTRADPGVVFADARRAFVTYAVVSAAEPFAILCARSRDGGATFDAPVTVVREDLASAADKPWPAVGLAPDGHEVVCVAYSNADGILKPRGVRLALSRDGGASFPEDVLVEGTDGATSYAQPVFGVHGEIYVLYIRQFDDGAQVRLARSDDGGRRFAPPVVVARTGLGFRRFLPAAPHRGIGPVVSMAIDRSPAHPGRLYVSYVAQARHAAAGDDADTDVYCRYADPAPGDPTQLTWSAEIPVHRGDTGTNFHAWLGLDPASGRVAVVSHNTRLDPERRAVHTWLSVSDDGLHWTERRISTWASDASRQFGRSPYNYLEYIGVAVRDGVAHATWAGVASGRGDIGQLEYLHAAVPLDSVAVGQARRVPQDYPDVTSALAAADAGDRVVLEGAGGPYAGGFALATHVRLTGAPGARPVIVGASAAPLFEIPIGYVGPGIAGLDLRGAGGTLIDLAATPSPLDGVVPDEMSPPPFRIESCALSGGDVAVASRGLPLELIDCRVTAAETGLHLRQDDPRAAGATLIRGNLLLAAEPGRSDTRGLVLVGVGLPGTSEIDRNTLHGWDAGFRFESEGRPGQPALSPRVHHNLVTGFRRAPLETATADVAAPARPVLAWNDFWSPGWWPETPGAGAALDSITPLSVDPLYCDARRGEFTLRLDSPVSRGNAPRGRIGALDVACAGEELLRDSRLPREGALRLTHGLRIPPLRRLTLEAGSALEFVAAAEPAGGDAERPGLAVYGALRINGTAERPVTLHAAADSPGPWGGVSMLGDAATLEVRQARFSNSRAGLRIEGGRAVVEDSEFSENAGCDIVVGHPRAPVRLVGNRLIVGEGSGLCATGPVDVRGCAFEGDAASGAGLRLVGGFGLGADIIDNRLDGFAAGAGIELIDVDEPLLLRGNTFEGNATAVEFRRATARAEAAPCTPAARLRGNFFGRNAEAVVVRIGARPPDLGTPDDLGGNSFGAGVGLCVNNESAASCGPVTARGNRFVERTPVGCTQPAEGADFAGWTSGSPESPCAGGAGGALCPPSLQPNPFRATLHIQFLPPAGTAGSRLTLDVLDVAGRRVRRLLDEPAADRAVGATATTRVVEWDGRDASGARVASGIYWVALRVEGRLWWGRKVVRAG